MHIWSIQGNRQRLDGGAMFGNVPKALWSRWFEPDVENRIDLSCRALLVREDSGRHILFETGIGAFFEPKLKARFGVTESNHALIDNLQAMGLSTSDIDMVVLSHLHFDHAGGLLTSWCAGEPLALCFPRAAVVVGRAAWSRACSPHARDRASFIPELQGLLEASGRLRIVDGNSDSVLGDGYRFHYSEGHTPGLMLTEISTSRGPLVFAGDLIPGTAWVHLPITMGYDRFPERLIDEKQALLEDLKSRGGALFFTHDPTVAMGHVVCDERGRFSVDNVFQDEAVNGISL